MQELKLRLQGKGGRVGEENMCQAEDLAQIRKEHAD